MKKQQFTRVKEKIKIFENNYFITYKYIFNNGNSVNSTVDKQKTKSYKSQEYVGKDKRIENKMLKKKVDMNDFIE